MSETNIITYSNFCLHILAAYFSLVSSVKWINPNL